MNLDDLKRVNRLWNSIYPYIVAQILEIFPKDTGRVLELGPFSGGLSMALCSRCPQFQVTLADASLQVLAYFEQEVQAAGLQQRIKTVQTSFDPLVFQDAQFDLVLCRGLFFFLDEEGRLLREIYRVLQTGAAAFVGGGFGKDTPRALIDEISDESRLLNDRLGRKRVSVGQLQQIVRQAQLPQGSRIVQEGGLWVVIDKRKE